MNMKAKLDSGLEVELSEADEVSKMHLNFRS
jgi:hypothetical protein